MALIFIFSLFFISSCVTYKVPSPSLHLETLPPSQVASLSLEERILLEEAWKELREGKVKKAESIFSKLGTGNPFYYSGMGYVYLLLENLKLAEDYFKASLRYYPQIDHAHLGLAQVYLKMGEDNSVFQELREILKREPEHSWARPNYEELRKRMTEEAMNEARAYEKSGNIEKSKEAFLRALYYSPKSTEAHLALAEIFRKENNLQNALVHLKAAAFNEPKNKEILKKYGNFLFEAEEYQESLTVYEKLAELDPENKEILTKIETLKNRLGVFELPSQYDAIPSSDAITREEAAALISVKFKDFLNSTQTKPPIIVDIATSWAAKHILKVTSFEILEVYPNHTFQPKKVITRAEMADILVRLISYLKKRGFSFIQHIPPEKINISDVSPDNFYYQAIVEIVSYDIMNLSTRNTFNPDLLVSGAECIRLFDLVLNLIK